MTKIFRKISEARLVNIHRGSLASWKNGTMKIHAKAFRHNHFIYSLRDASDRFIYTEFSTKPSIYPVFGTVIIDEFRGKMLRVTRSQMVVAALGKSGSYPTVSSAVSYNANSILSTVWTFIKIMVRQP